MNSRSSCETFQPLAAAAASSRAFSETETLTRMNSSRGSIGAILSSLQPHLMAKRDLFKPPNTLAAAGAMTPETLAAVAIEHARSVASDRRDPCWEPAPESEHRLIVNMLRHRCTRYEDRGATAEAKRDAHIAISTALPWLASECQRQMEQREQEEALAEQMAQEAREDARLRTANRRQWIKDSKALIASGAIAEGMAVNVQVRNHLRLVTVAAVAAPKVKVVYSLKSGQPREDWLYASWCQLAGACNA
jgi:hypothetical protein